MLIIVSAQGLKRNNTPKRSVQCTAKCSLKHVCFNILDILYNIYIIFI